MIKQLEIQKLKLRVNKQYDIVADDVELSPFGAGSLTHFISSENRKYVVKYPSENCMNHIESEPTICEFLLLHNIPACKFIQNKQRKKISVDENGRQYHVQEYIEGITYDYNEVPNIINRNFKADKPHEKALTDISEFGMCDGKVYLSPLIDCYDGLPITWTIGKSPNQILTNTMLDEAHKIIGDKSIIIHSDRGFHYRIPGWIDMMKQYGYKRSMSKKGCSPDNSMYDVFGTLKNEFFYSRDWSKTK